MGWPFEFAPGEPEPLDTKLPKVFCAEFVSHFSAKVPDVLDDPLLANLRFSVVEQDLDRAEDKFQPVMWQECKVIEKLEEGLVLGAVSLKYEQLRTFEAGGAGAARGSAAAAPASGAAALAGRLGLPLIKRVAEAPSVYSATGVLVKVRLRACMHALHRVVLRMRARVHARTHRPVQVANTGLLCPQVTELQRSVQELTGAAHRWCLLGSSRWG